MPWCWRNTVLHNGPDIEGCLWCQRLKWTAAGYHLTSKGLAPSRLKRHTAMHRHLKRDHVQHGPDVQDFLRCCRLRRTGWRLWSTWLARAAT